MKLFLAKNIFSHKLNIIFFILIFVIASAVTSFASATTSEKLSLTPLAPEQNSSAIKIEDAAKPESDTIKVIRDAGVGLGVGAVVGLGFVITSTGHFPPHDANSRDRDGLMTGLIVGLGGGIATGLWQVRREHQLQLAVSPPLTDKATPSISGKVDF